LQSYAHVSLVTLLAICVYFWMAIQVARTRTKVGILAPVMSGDPLLERTIRAHLNMLEWFPIFLPAMWLFAIYWKATAAALLGIVWVIGRIVYFVGYVAEARRRFPGFFIQSLAAAVLVLGAAGRILYLTWA